MSRQAYLVQEQLILSNNGGVLIKREEISFNEYSTIQIDRATNNQTRLLRQLVKVVDSEQQDELVGVL